MSKAKSSGGSFVATPDRECPYCKGSRNHSVAQRKRCKDQASGGGKKK